MVSLSRGCLFSLSRQSHWALVVSAVSSFNFRWPDILIHFMNDLRTTFSFMSLTLFRPECELNVPYFYRWIVRIATPLILIYIVWVVSSLHNIVACYLFSRNKRYPRAPVNIAMCELGVCSELVSHYIRDPNTMEFRFMCDVCAISHKYRPAQYSSSVDAASSSTDASLDSPNLRAYPMPPGLTFGSMSGGQKVSMLVKLVIEDIRHSRRALVFAILQALLLAGAFVSASILTQRDIKTGYAQFSPYVVAVVSFVASVFVGFSPTQSIPHWWRVGSV